MNVPRQSGGIRSHSIRFARYGTATSVEKPLECVRIPSLSFETREAQLGWRRPESANERPKAKRRDTLALHTLRALRNGNKRGEAFGVRAYPIAFVRDSRSSVGVALVQRMPLVSGFDSPYVAAYKGFVSAILTLGIWLSASIWATAAASPQPCRIEVVEKGTGWPVPLVELRTTHNVRFVTDKAGVIAFDLPELMGRETWFDIVGNGYEVPRDGFGSRGVRLKPEPGGNLKVEVTRKTIAKRLGQIG